MLSRVRAIAESNIGIMGHVGLTPQSATKLGGFKAQGRTADAAQAALRRRARAAGGRGVRDRARGRPGARRGRVTEALQVPTIGIGAGAGTRRPGARLARHARDVRRPHATFRQALRRDRGRDRRRRGRVRGRRPRRERSRRSSTRTASRRTSSSGSRRRSERAERDQEQDRERQCERGRGARARPRPAVHRAHADHEQDDRPREEAGEERGNAWAPAPLSRPPLRNTSSP